MPLFVSDLRGSTIRTRAVRRRRRELWLLYVELLLALQEAPGGELSADPEALADETGGLFEPGEIAELLPLLKPAAGKRGGIVVEGGLIRNPRIEASTVDDLDYKAARSLDGKRSAEQRRKKYGTAQPVKKESDLRENSKVSEGTFDAPRRYVEPPDPEPDPEPGRMEEHARVVPSSPHNPLVDREAQIREGYRLIPEIAAAENLDPTEVLSKASAWNGKSLVRLDTIIGDDRLAHTVNTLRSWSRRLSGKTEPEPPMPQPRASPSGRAGIAETTRRGLEQLSKSLEKREERDAEAESRRLSARDGQAGRGLPPARPDR